MKRNTSIRLKAAFLLLVFALNTVVGFACAVGVDMGFNSSYYHDKATEVPVDVHADGKKHHHDDTNKDHNDKKETSKKDDCCNDNVIKFQNLDKSLNQNAKTAIDAPVFAAIISTFLGNDVFKISKAYPLKYKAWFFYPPPPDIRIAIQSFQI